MPFAIAADVLLNRQMRAVNNNHVPCLTEEKSSRKSLPVAHHSSNA